MAIEVLIDTPSQQSESRYRAYRWGMDNVHARARSRLVTLIQGLVDAKTAQKGSWGCDQGPDAQDSPGGASETDSEEVVPAGLIKDFRDFQAGSREERTGG